MKTAPFRRRRGAAILAMLVGGALAATISPNVQAQQWTAAPAADRAQATEHGQAEPIVIGHRGAPGYRPEHTLASYRLAIQLGADYIEPDLVSTKDGVLVARHENEISTTTDVADHPEFADRRTTKVIDGVSLTGWFTEDFTLAELKTLRAIERLPDVRPANTRYDGRFEVPTFDEVLRLVREESRRYHRTVGVYPETKHPTYFRSIGLPIEHRMLRDLKQAGLDKPRSKVFIQSFETGNLRRLDRITNLRLIQLMDSTGAPDGRGAAGGPGAYADLVEPAGLRWISRYADGIGPNKDLVIPRDAAGFLLAPTTLVADAHRQGLLVHLFTFRDENQFLPADFRVGDDPNAKGDDFAEYDAFFDQGIDGLFSDYTDTAVSAREFYYEDTT